MKLRQNITIASCGTHHLCEDKALYSNRFLSVLKFANNGLAAVKDKIGAYHININGRPTYLERYTSTYGFYCGLAAVVDKGKAFHIYDDGKRAYKNSYSWVGNFQEDFCVVKEGKKFYHIDKNGKPIYSQKYDYVGDFKDGVAVVHKNGLATHIDSKGRYIHNNWFKQLDIYHKGYARAADERGWFHVDRNGKEIYTTRYKSIEPFYNDLAIVEGFDGSMLQINPANEIITTILPSNPSFYINQLSDDMVGFWKTFSIYTGVTLGIFNHLPAGLLDLSKKIKVPKNNLNRILRALWEMNLITYDVKKEIWNLAEKGRLLASFMSEASMLWANVANQDWIKLPKLLKAGITQHPSFKDAETNKQNTISYLRALEGYAIKDLSEYFDNHPLDNKNVLGFGRTSLGLLKHLKIDSPTVMVDSIIPKAYLSGTKIKMIKTFKQSSIDFDVALLLRFLHYFDDEIALSYLKKIRQLKIPKLMIFETIVSHNSPNGGLLDLNMIIETGGKLRTLDEWQKLLKQANYSLNAVKEINPYLTLLEAVVK